MTEQHKTGAPGVLLCEMVVWYGMFIDCNHMITKSYTIYKWVEIQHDIYIVLVRTNNKVCNKVRYGLYRNNINWDLYLYLYIYIP